MTQRAYPPHQLTASYRISFRIPSCSLLLVSLIRRLILILVFLVDLRSILMADLRNAQLGFALPHFIKVILVTVDYRHFLIGLFIDLIESFLHLFLLNLQSDCHLIYFP